MTNDNIHGFTDDLTSTLFKHKREAERLFSACVLIQPNRARHDCGWLKPSQFSDKRFGKFWGDVLEGKNEHTAAIDAQVYTELFAAQNDISTSMGYEGFAKTIADDFRLTEISILLSKMAIAVGERDQVKLAKLLQSVSSERSASEYEMPSIADIAMAFAETIGQVDQTIQTSITPYDNAIGGYAKGTLNLIAARPSMGKTSLAWQIARNMSASKKKVIYFSVEMKATLLWARAACGILEYSLKDYLNNNLTEKQNTLLIDANANLMNNHIDYLNIDDRSRLTSEDIWKAVAKHQPDCIIVDHISLLSDKAENEIKRLGNITWAGKQIAKEYDLVSIYLQQLNRGVEYRGDKRPTMSDLRDSGETEQNADTVTFIYRPDYYDVGTPPVVSDTELIIAKNRNGERNIIANTKYHLKQQWFYSANELTQKVAEKMSL